jgi:SAM-dependent methyltransferase
VLEVGCGQGRLGARIAARLPYLGLEPDAESCRSADAHIRPLGGEVRCASVDQLDPDERFGVLCAFEVLEHLEDDHGQLARWVRHLGPGGTAIVSVPAWPDRFGRWDEAVGHLRRYEPDTLRALLEGAGLEAVTTSVYGWPLGDLLERGRNLMAGRARTGASTSSRTAASGRQLQPGRLSGPLIRAGVVPFTGLQRLRPTAGPALLGWGRMP